MHTTGLLCANSCLGSSCGGRPTHKCFKSALLLFANHLEVHRSLPLGRRNSDLLLDQLFCNVFDAAHIYAAVLQTQAENQ